MDHSEIQVRPVNEFGMESIDTAGADQYDRYSVHRVAERKQLELLINFEHAVINKQSTAGREEANDAAGAHICLEHI